MSYLCRRCLIMGIADDEVIDGNCPICGEPAEKQCPRDHIDRCTDEIHTSLAYCPECGKPVCPTCGSHDVMQVSRVTGYLQDVGGWNNAKKQELKDRTRYNINGEIVDGVQ